MSKVAITGNASGTGVFTIASPNSNTDRTLNLPDSAGTIATAESTLAQFNASGSAPVYACRAWVNFDGTGTVAIRASGNVSSITDNGTGDYTVNFTTAMPDANYATVSNNNNSDNWSTISTVLAASVRLTCRDSGGTLQDASIFTTTIFR
jgi:hypothetical protein